MKNIYTTLNKIKTTKVFIIVLLFMACLLTSVQTYAQDTDGDGIDNFDDLDNDNDGILDIQETKTSYVGQLNGLSNWSLSGNVSGNSSFVFDFYNRSPLNNGVAIGTISDELKGQTYSMYIELNGWDGSPSSYQNSVKFEVIEGGSLLFSRTLNANTISGGNKAVVDVIYFSSVTGQFIIKITDLTTGQFSGSEGFYYPEVKLRLSGLVCADTDKDGIDDCLDLDSDNDGIYDIVESGADYATLDPDGDGLINGAQFVDVDTDGLADAIETTNGANTGTPPRNTTMSGLPNFRKTYSDSDNCSDANEAYNDPNADGGDGGIYNPLGVSEPLKLINGTIDAQGRVVAASYNNTTTPFDGDGNLTEDYIQASRVLTGISTQPSDKLSIMVGSNTSFTVTETTTGSGTAVNYQWQESIDNGITFNNITNGGVYSNATTATLNLTGITWAILNNQYRAFIHTPSYICDTDQTSTPALLTIIGNDFGDAPDTYATNLADGGEGVGPSHRVDATIFIGSTVDGETNGKPSGDADADGLDEDGVTLPSKFIPSISTTIDVAVTEVSIGTANLTAWIDWNADGSFSVSEQIAVDIKDGGINDVDAAANGMIQIAVTTPSDAVASPSFARFRWSTDANLSFTGFASNGEVEDYQVTIVPFNGFPGGVYQDLTLWMRADKGAYSDVNATVPATDGDGVLVWKDQSNGKHYRPSNDATEGAAVTTARAPNFLAIETPIILDKQFMNFNPALDFDYGDFLRNTAYAPVSGGTDSSFEYRAAFLPSTNPLRNTLFAQSDRAPGSAASYDDIEIFGSGSTYYDFYLSNTVGYRLYGIQPNILGFNHNAGNDLTSLSLNGKIKETGTVSYNIPTVSGSTIGEDYYGSSEDNPLSTVFGELIVYDRELSTLERQKVDTYLALKYGLTLGDEDNISPYLPTPIDYIDPSGNIVWDVSANAGYTYNVAGIFRDDLSMHEQRQSQSTDRDPNNLGSTYIPPVTIGLGDITTSNANNPNHFALSGQYLIWGDNRGSLTTTTTINLPIGSSSITVPGKRINRSWKVVESGGDVPMVRVAVLEASLAALGGLLPDEYYVMVVADDASFSTNVKYTPLDNTPISVVGQASRTTTYDFNGDKYFSFAKGGTHEEPLHMIFDGVDDAIAVNKNVVEGSAYTLMAWVKLNGPNALNGNRTILAKHNGTNGYKLAIKNDNTVAFTLGGTPILNSTVALPNGVWHHLTVTYNGSTAKLYIDGVLADSGAASPSTAANAYFAMGAVYETASPTNLFKGNLDEVRVFKKVLSQDQFRFIINQEIIKDGTAIKGAIIPTSISKYDISGLPYNDLAAYFNMNVYGLDAVMDVSNNAHRGYIAPTVGVDLAPQRPPLPYQTRADGSWNVDTIWSASSDVYIPGSASIVDPNITVDWNIVETTNNVTMNNSSLPNGSNNRTLLSLEVQSNTLSVANASALSITHNLSLYGKIDLQGEAQLIQTNDSDLDTSSPGSIERDQQGTLDKYTYNYWSSPVGALGTLANNQAISLKNVLKDGTNPNAPQTINWTSSYSAASPSSPITMSSYWVYSYLNSAWSQVRETGTIQPGVGFTSKGVGTGISTDQNYVFVGKPNNGNISVPLNAGKEYLVGNPYPSALDANQFIDDNIAVIEGTLYFWEHWGGGSHIQREYQGGYATLTKAGGVKAIVHPKVSDLGGTVGTKEPKQFIPVAQGFLVNAVNGGTLKFNNGQRVFKTEGTASVFLRAAAPVKEQAKVATEDTRMKIWLKIKAGTGVERELLLAFDTNTTVGYDNGYDGAIADAHTSDHYWPLGDRKLVINALPQWSEDLEVPVGLISEKPGSSEFFISRLENVPESTPLYILDKDTGLTHDLRAANVVLPITQGEFNNRFQLVFKPSVSLSNTQEEIQQDFQIITKDKGIEIVNHKGLQIQQVKVHNIIGQQILEQKHGLDKGKSTTIALEVATGVYLVTVATPNGTWTKKVLMQ